MADIIKIKRSASTAAPTSLAAGELAYSENSGNFFIGRIADGAPVVIGGKALVDKVANLATTDISGFNTAVDGRIALADLEDLANVNVSSPADGTVLTWNNSTSKWVASAPAGGVSSFVQLNDVPSAYTGQGGSFVRVNAGATALEFVSAIDGGSF